ncbi:MAG: ATP synthase F1 subunit epsilon [Vicingaceae bacterium]|nr:ATP synthase F1 subunit epsilon [Vicingaceae bacterium]
MQLDIITPEKNVYSGEVEMVNLPGSDGSFGILKDHAPLVSTLKAGEIKVVENGSEKLFSVKGGVVEVNSNKIIVLAE